MIFICIAQIASRGPDAGGNLVVSLFPFILVMGIFYLLLLRPQQKKQKEHDRMLKTLQKGDRIVTTGGIYGVITYVKEKTLTVKVADNVKIELSRAHVGCRLNQEREEMPQEEKKE